MTEEASHSDFESDSYVRDFLLGRLAELKRERFEERLLVDASFGEFVSAVEEEMMDDYTAGLLSGDERRQFEEHFLVTEDRRRRLQFSAALARAGVAGGVVSSEAALAKSRPSPTRRTEKGHAWAQILAASIAAIAVAFASWMFLDLRDTRAKSSRIEQEIAALRAERDRLAARYGLEPGDGGTPREGLAVPEPREPRGGTKIEAPGTPVMVALLEPGRLRGSESTATTLAVASTNQILRFQLDLEEDDFPSHIASVQGADGRELVRIAGLRSTKTDQHILVVLDVPASLLAEGDYSILLLGEVKGHRDELGRYYFRVVRSAGDGKGGQIEK